MECTLVISSPAGPLTLSATECGLTAIRFGVAPASENAASRSGEAASAGMQGLQGGASAGVQGLPGGASSAGAQEHLSDRALSEGRTAEAVLRRAAEELAEYFAGKRRAFTLPLAPAGTPFQQRVWDELRTIPYGRTRTYQQIAAAIGRPRACRAVGMANHRNPLPIVVPCHRVVGASGALVGYAGGVELKARLLELEAGR